MMKSLILIYQIILNIQLFFIKNNSKIKDNEIINLYN